MKSLLLKLHALLLFVPNWFLHGSPLKVDEEIVLFPTHASQIGDGNWRVPVHAWVFEPEEDSLSRAVSRHAIAELLELTDITEEQAHSELFKERIKWFLVDNERNKRLSLTINGQTFQSSRSKANGHLLFDIKVKTEARPGAWLDLPVTLPQGDKRHFSAASQLVPAQGLSVISDIDDTIKISEVIDKEALIEHVFFKEYETTPGMPAFYRELEKQGAYFHYISASPWQLYPSLKPFVEQHYPRGYFSLRYFRATDSSFIHFFRSSMGYKIDTIERIIRRYPGHEFILIGDSGEKDPEVYAQICREFPQRIRKILIRRVEGSDLSPVRLDKTFEGIPDIKWQFFDIPENTLLVNQEIS